jgi:hypothetical protein
MLPASDDQETIRKDLLAKRKPLAEWFEKHPTQVRLALEIRSLDDQIASCNQVIRRAKHTRP